MNVIVHVITAAKQNPAPALFINSSRAVYVALR